MNKILVLGALLFTACGCTNDTTSFASELPPEAVIASLSDAERLALCESAERWTNDNANIAKLAGISQALQGEADVARCEAEVAPYERISVGGGGLVPIFSEGCGVVATRLTTCTETVDEFEALFEWTVSDVEWQLSMLSCDLITMPDVWREIAWGDRTPENLRAVDSCISGR